MKAHVTLGMYPNGEVGEIFVVVARVGSVMRTVFEAWAMTASKSLQCGTPLKDVAKSIRNINDGTCKRVIHHDDTTTDCSSLWDAIAQTLERHVE